MEVYYFNANLLARAFVFSDITAFYILCLEALSHEIEMPKLSGNKTDFRCTNFVVT